MSAHANATIIVPQFNRPELTCACIRSLRRYDSDRWPVLVIDDGSTATAAEKVSSEGFAATRVVAQPRRGVSAAWNRGASLARTSHLVFLNNDTLFEGPAVRDLIAPLVKGEALLSGVLMRRETDLPDDVLHNLPRRCFLQGWCFAIPLLDFRRLGGFDESMKIYWSDTDLQARLLRDSSDYQTSLATNPRLPVKHLAHCTARILPNRRRVWCRDRATFMQKWSSQ